MPFIKIQLLEGRSEKQKSEAAHKIAKVAAETLNAPVGNVKVIFEDMSKENYFDGNKM